jgi:hypothetical protein
MITPTALKLIEERGNLCEVCHMRQATEAHHCLYRRDKHQPRLNDKENLQLVCHPCHDNGSADSWANRVVFWQDQCTRYGASHMKEWHDKLDYKIKETLYR